MTDRTNHWDQVYQAGRNFTVFSDVLLQQLFDKYTFTGTALDVGCGTGDLATRLAKRGLTVTGIDLSTVAIAQAKQSGSGAKFLVQDLFDHHGQYDLITAKLVYAFFDPDKFVTKLKSLLSPGGKVLIETPVRLAGYHYDPHWTNISVDQAALHQQLETAFGQVDYFHTNYQDLAQAVETIVCS